MSAGPGEEAPSILDVVLRTHRRSGVAGLYKGLTPTLIKGVLQSAVMLAVKERVDAAVRAPLGMEARR